MSEIDKIRARLANGGNIFRRQTVEVLLAEYDAQAARIRELEAENQKLREDLLFHGVVTEPFTEGKCPECGAPSYRMGGQYMECHAGGCSRGKGGTPVLHREGGDE